MQIERARRRSSLPILPCGCLSVFGVCLVITVIGGIILLPSLPGIGAQLVGFQPGGSVDAVFAPDEINPPVIEDADFPDAITLEVGGYGEQTLINDPQLYDWSIGTVNSSRGAEPAASVSFSESGLMELCRQRTTLCTNENPQFKNAQVDLRSNGAVLYADATLAQLGGITQRIGLVMRVDASGRRIEFVGVDIGGVLYTSPPAELNQLVEDFERAANEAVVQIMLESGGTVYTLSRIFIDDSTATIILQ